MKTKWMLSENDWEYTGVIYVTSKEMPAVKKVNLVCYEMNVDEIVINFDEEIVLTKIIES